MPAAVSRLTEVTAIALRAQAAEYLRAGRLSEAERALQILLRERAADGEARYLLGLVALQAGNGPAAAVLLVPAAKRFPENAAAQYNAGVALVMSDRFDDAAEHFRRALTLDPGMAAAWNNLGNIAKAFGDVEEATTNFERAVALSPSDSVSRSHHLICAHYDSRFSHDQLFRLHRLWAERYAAPFYPRTPPTVQNPDPERRLRVGLVSPSFNGKIVGQFLRGVLPHLREANLQVFAYSSTLETDQMTQALRQCVDRWREIGGLDDEEAARLIRSERIDILIDLAGHAPGNRLLVFARKPAPLQVSWLDYFDTTGLDSIDYLITDPRTTPAGSPQRFAEQLIFLPETRLCWTPPEFAPPVAVPPLGRYGRITFGSYNRADKLNPGLLAVWARILAHVPQARLLLKGVAYAQSEVRRHFGERFARLGVSSDRIEWRGPSSHAELLAEYAEIDIALDTTPYNGGATTCDALWMGVPVIALRAERMIARQSAAMLDCIGHGEFVADSLEGYVELAVGLAADSARLAALRTELRDAMMQSPLCDGRRFARDFAAALRKVWRLRCQELNQE